MRANTENDFLIAPASTRDLRAQHQNDGPADIARVRAALHEDARPEVRRNAIVALSASLQERALPDYIAALDDTAPQVAGEAAAALATYGAPTTGRDENAEALGALRSHAVVLRAALTSPDITTRYNVARALRVIADPDTDLGIVLGDQTSLVRSEGLGLAASRTLGAADVALLDKVARQDSDPALRARAVTVVAAKAPAELAAPVVSAALGRNDVDRTTADAVSEAHLTAVIPAILTYLRARPYRLEWLTTLIAFNPPCAARTLAGMLSDATSGHAAEQALRTMSGKPSLSTEQLVVWANAQPDDVAPCAGSAPAR